MAVMIKKLYRYPVKGMTAQPLDRVDLEVGREMPFDRAYALARSNTAFDSGHPTWLAKTNFLMLMRDERMAEIEAGFDPATKTLSLSLEGRALAEGCLDDADGRARIENAVADVLGLGESERPRLVAAPGHTFSDYDAKVISLINLASVEALAEVMGEPVDPLRFRGNLYVEGAAPWAEFDWIGRQIKIGGVVLEPIHRTKRCAATNVNPVTAARDLNIPKALQKTYGHMDMGIYARVVAPGTIAPGKSLEIS